MRSGLLGGTAAAAQCRRRPPAARPARHPLQARSTTHNIHNRLGAHKSIGPNAQLAIFHDACAMIGTTLAISLHGSAAAWPLAFLCAGKLLVGGLHALGLRRSLAFAVVWAYATAALAVTSAFEGAGAAFWCERLLSIHAASTWMPTALALDRFTGVAPAHFTVGVAFRYTILRFIRWVQWRYRVCVLPGGRSGCWGGGEVGAGCQAAPCAHLHPPAPYPPPPCISCSATPAGRWTA